MGPAADPTGSTAAWFEGSDLVMFDTATGQELARADQSTTMPSAPGTRSRSGNRILEVTGNLILDVTPDRVYWWGEVLYRFDLTTGKTTTVSPQATNVSTLDYADVRSCCIAPFAVTSDEVTSTISPSSAIMHTFEVGELVQPLFFNADGSYLAALNVDGDELRAAVANVMTDEIFYPSPQHSYPSIGWGYGNTLMVYEATGRRDEQLLACDVSNQSCQPMEHTGPVMLPSS